MTNHNRLAGKFRSNNLKRLGALFSAVSGKCGQVFCLLFPHYVRYVIIIYFKNSLNQFKMQVCNCLILTSPNFEDFAKKSKNFTFNMVLTLFILLYASL